MCKSKLDAAASLPTPRDHPTTSSSATTATSATAASSSSLSISSLRSLHSDALLLYSAAEIRSATNNFLSGRLASPSSSSAPAWRCTLRGRDAVVLQLHLRGDPSRLPDCLASLSRCNHAGLVRLLGASVAGPTSLHLVYQHTPGAPLSLCLRKPRSAALPTWASRMQVATDVAQALEYVHRHAGLIHGRLSSSTVTVTDPDLRGRLCHFAAAELAGENDPGKDRPRRVEGARGYVAPEVLAGARPSQEADVYALGLVLLELVSGEEAVRYRCEGDKVVALTLAATAREVWRSGTEEDRMRRLRRWVDRRMGDSFPVEVAERVLRLALDCVEEEPERRPAAEKVAGKMSALLQQSVKWAEKMKLPQEITVSLGPR